MNYSNEGLTAQSEALDPNLGEGDYLFLQDWLFGVGPETRRLCMSCYFRHMKDIFEEVGIEVTKENKKELDRVVHQLVDEAYKNCSPTWKGVKEHIKGDEKARQQFVRKLKKAVKAI
jgi:hypothetical protein